MLEYVYRGKIDQISTSTASELLAASDLYQLPGLKSACVCVLESPINVENAVRILQLGNLYDQTLKSRAVEYICEHFEDLESTAEWIALQKEEPSLVFEVMSAKIKYLSGNSHPSRAFSQKNAKPLSIRERNNIKKKDENFLVFCLAILFVLAYVVFVSGGAARVIGILSLYCKKFCESD